LTTCPQKLTMVKVFRPQYSRLEISKVSLMPSSFAKMKLFVIKGNLPKSQPEFEFMINESIHMEIDSTIEKQPYL